jgi:LemA protein
MTWFVLIVLAAAILIAAIALWAMFNRLVGLRNRVKESWSDVDVALKRRYNLIPNLVETVRGYAKHERDVLQLVIEARTRAVASTGRPSEQAKDENALVLALNRCAAVIERYPELKANAQFLKLQEELIESEDRIQAARRFYNGNVRDYQIARESFPNNIVARKFHFAPADFFEVESSAIRQAPQVAGRL